MPILERDIMGGLAKGLMVIETFTATRPRQSISEVAAASGLDRATARRCLLTLTHQGYSNWDGKYFTLTPRVLRLGTACLATMPLPQIVQPLLDRLSDEIGHSSSVSILDGAEIVYIARAVQQKVMSVTLMPGSRLPAYCTSMGRVLLAALPDAEVRGILGTALLPARTERTLTDPENIFTEIAKIRDAGYALINQEVELGLVSIALPVLNARGQVVAALNIGMAAGTADFATITTSYLRAMTAVQTELKSMLR